MPPKISPRVEDITVKDIHSFLLRILDTKNETYDSPYHCNRYPSIDLSKYIERFQLYLEVEDYTYLITAIIYILRMRRICGAEFISKNSIFRLLLVSIVVAHKWCYDIPETNNYFARVGGVSLQELNALELNMLLLFEFKAHVSEQEYDVIHELIKPSSIESKKSMELQYFDKWRDPRASFVR